MAGKVKNNQKFTSNDENDVLKIASKILKKHRRAFEVLGQ